MKGVVQVIKVIIFCANGQGEQVLYSLDEEKVKVTAFSDNDSRLWGGYCAGIAVIPPNRLADAEFDYIIIACAEYAKPIWKQLLSIGVRGEQVIVFQENRQDIIWFENRIAQMRKCLDVVRERKLPGNAAEVGVYRGDFARLINRYMPDSFCFVSFDADLYQPIKAGLEYFYLRMLLGGYIFVHDFGTQHWDGATQAVYEFCEENGVSFFPLLDRALSAVFVK